MCILIEHFNDSNRLKIKQPILKILAESMWKIYIDWKKVKRVENILLVIDNEKFKETNQTIVDKEVFNVNVELYDF